MSRLAELRERIASRDASMGVIGLGYVGLPLALELARAGFDVTGIDIDGEKVEAIETDRSYVEDVTSEAIALVRREGKLHATSDYGGPSAPRRHSHLRFRRH